MEVDLDPNCKSYYWGLFHWTCSVLFIFQGFQPFLLTARCGYIGCSLFINLLLPMIDVIYGRIKQTHWSPRSGIH